MKKKIPTDWAKLTLVFEELKYKKNQRKLIH